MDAMTIGNGITAFNSLFRNSISGLPKLRTSVSTLAYLTTGQLVEDFNKVFMMSIYLSAALILVLAAFAAGLIVRLNMVFDKLMQTYNVLRPEEVQMQDSLLQKLLDAIIKDGLNEDKMIQTYFKKSANLSMTDMSNESVHNGKKALVKKPLYKPKRNFKLSKTKSYRGTRSTIMTFASTIICMISYIVVYFLVVGNVNKVVDIQKFYFKIYDDLVQVDLNFVAYILQANYGNNLMMDGVFAGDYKDNDSIKNLLSGWAK